MSYRETIISQNPLSFWPLDDDASLGIAKEATGRGNDASYNGQIFDYAIPLVSNGIYGTRLLDDSAFIEYPLPGSKNISSSWVSPGIWTIGREQKTFSAEVYFKLETNDLELSEDIVIFGDSSPNLYGIYLSGNRIYFKPDPARDYFVSYQVPDWKRRYHVVANYSLSQISLIVNGKSVSYKYATELDEGFSFSREDGTVKTIGSDTYKITIDAIAMYGYNLDKSRALDHSDLSRKSLGKGNYYNSNSQVYYLPNNSECQFSYKFVNNWFDFDFTNAVTDDDLGITLRSIDDQLISSGSPTFSTAGSRNSLQLSNSQYLDISNITSLADSGTAISLSFFKPATNNYALLSLENSYSSQSFSVYVNLDGYIVIELNGEETVTEIEPDSGWNEILVNNRSGALDVYLNEDSVFSSVGFLSSITRAYIGRVNDLYSDINISWVAIKSNTQNETTPTETLYGLESDFILKLDGSLRWSQFGYVNGILYVPSYDYDGSLAFYTASSSNVSVTYNEDLPWPKMGSLPNLLDDPTGQVNLYEIYIKLSTDDSVNDLPKLINLGLYAYSEDMKRVVPENSYGLATLFNKDEAVVFDDDVEILDRLDQSGVRLSGSSYLAVPSQSQNFDTGGFNGTKSISLVFKINEPLSANKYILQSGSKSLYWNGTAWQYPGFNNIYVNGQSSFDNEAMVDDWVHVVLTSTSKIDAGNLIYIGADSTGGNQTDLTLGSLAMAAYTLDAFDAETEYEVFVGFPQEGLVSDTVEFNIIDYGLTPYRFALQRA